MPISSYPSRFRRAIPALPDTATLTFPANLIVGCSDCGLKNGCTRPVPGERADEHHEVMLVGQNPGKNEDLEGRPFCVDENTKVLMADLSWRSIKDVKIGNQVLSCDEFGGYREFGASHTDNRRLRVATVTKKITQVADCIRLSTPDGSLILTPDHKVLTRYASRSHTSRWLEAGRCVLGKKHRSALSFMFKPWGQRDGYDAGWLAGFFDGEGHVTKRSATAQSKRSVLTVGVGQKQGALSDRVQWLLHCRGFTTYMNGEQRCYNGTIMEHIVIKGGIREQLRFLGTIRPWRLLDKVKIMLSTGDTPAVKATASVLTDKVHIGQRTVVDIQTTSGTFIANGFIVHNCGQAGQYLDSLLFQAGVPRENVAVCNIVKCLTSNNRTPTPAEIQACSHWLDIELGIVQPRIIVAMGAPAIARFLGSGAGTVEHLHGKPVEVDGRIILPAYHPAAALHNTTLLRQCQEDFQVLRGLVKGRDWREYHVQDEYPNPVYRVADTDELLAEMADEIAESGEFAVDTEICRGKLWSVQISAKPGTAWFIPVRDGYTGRVDLTKSAGTAIVHNYLFDTQYLKIREDDFVDTMTCAYLIGAAQGLKELASRLCGIKMQSYAEVVRPGQHKLALAYLNKAIKREWPDPPTIEETKWDNKKGELLTKTKKPWHISRKIDKMLGDLADNPDTDLWSRWQSIPEEERAVVESVLGAMPESSLADIPREQAVAYSAKDSDATLRVYHKLKKLIADLDLDFVLNMDLGILPMVDEMMRNGMAVDLDHFRKLSEDYDVRMRVKSAELAGMVGHPFNPNSRPQVAQVIYSELGFKSVAHTPTGEVSTDDQELKKTGHPVAKGIIEYRRLSKMKGTYADNFVLYADSEGRVHTTIKTTRTETGRLASADPLNFQNIPTRSREGKAIKNGFVAPDGWIMGEGDLGQIEVCVQADAARCKGLIDIFLNGQDPHTLTASRIFGVPYEDAKQEKYRYPTKRANFGIIYMIGAQGLSAQIAEYIADLKMEGEPVEVEPWSVETCEKFITDWYRLYPEVKEYQQEQAAMARRHGYVRDMFGRIRYIPEVSCPIRYIQEGGLRMAANMPIQAGAQGIIKLGMGELWRELPKTDWADDVRYLMQVHDSLIDQLRDDEAVYLPCLRWMRDVMCGVVKLLVPVKVDFKIGKRWGSLEKVVLE